MLRLASVLVIVTVTCNATFADEYPWKQPTFVEGKTISVEDGEIYYECYGDPNNEPLLLVHGFSSTGRETWTPVIEEFSQKYRLIVPDLRGHGRSINRAGEFMHRRSALDILALLEHLKIKRVQAMGVSSGGMTLIHMAMERPDCLEAMVLIGSTHNRNIKPAEPVDTPTVKQLLDDAGPWGGLRRLRPLHKHGKQQIRKMCKDFVALQSRTDDMAFAPDDLGKITARTLIVQGDRDAFFPVEAVLTMYRSIPDSYLWIVPWGGHVPIYKQRVTFSETALGFLDRTWDYADVDLNNPEGAY